MGSPEHEEEEGPVHRVTVETFSIDRFDVPTRKSPSLWRRPTV